MAPDCEDEREIKSVLSTTKPLRATRPTSKMECATLQKDSVQHLQLSKDFLLSFQYLVFRRSVARVVVSRRSLAMKDDAINLQN